MRKLLTVLALVAGCDDVPVEPTPDATIDAAAPIVDDLQGLWSLTWTCDGFCPYEPPVVLTERVTIEGNRLTFSGGPEGSSASHDGHESGGCLAVDGADEDGVRRSPYALCRIGDLAEDVIAWIGAPEGWSRWRLQVWR